MKKTGKGSDGSVSLPAVVDLPQAAKLKAQLERGLERGKGLTIDGAAVRRISSPCLQVLIAGMNAFTTAGGPPMKIVNPSAAFLEIVSALGLQDALGMVGA